MSRGSIAAKVRREKDDHPERFCPVGRCLWRTFVRGQHTVCAKHPERSRAANIDRERRAA